MHIRKYDFNYGRRELMKKIAVGAGAGVLMPLHEVIAAGKDISKAYPDELMSIEGITKGKVKTGDYITAANVEYVKDLLDPIVYGQIKDMGRKIKIKATERTPTNLFPGQFYEAMQRNNSSGTTAKFNADGNVVTHDNKPWVGGLPFPDPKNGLELQANMAMSWGRGDYNQYAIKETDINPDGNVAYNYDLVWAELQTQARMDGKIFRDMKDLLRFQTVYFTSTADVAGSSFLSTWYYDQRKFPELYGYLPQFKRVRQFPTNQRFEPLIPGVTWFLTDPWAAGDPMLTWGEYKIIERKPMLGAYNTTWSGDRPNWEKPVHGGPKGITFYDTEYELAPEVAILESKPVGYPRAPVGRRLAYVDVRNSLYSGNIRFDRQDKPWVSFETGFGQYVNGSKKVVGADGTTPAYSWIYVMSYDCQNKRMSRAAHAEQCFGGYKSLFNGDHEQMYNKFFTQQALQRLGQV